MVSIQTNFISGAVNSIYNAISWSQTHNLIAYSCSNQIYLFDPCQTLVFASLNSKAKRANCVKFLDNFDVCTLVTSDSQGNVTVWEAKEKPFNAENWCETYKITLSSGIENLSILYIGHNFTLILAHEINGEISLLSLNRKDQEFVVIDKLYFGNHVQETSAMLKVPNSDNVLVILGGLDNKLHVYSFSLNDVNERKKDIFQYLLSLKGHENAITDIKIIELDEKENNKSALIASSSKDSYIRLWRFQKQNANKQSEKLNELNITNKNNYPFIINQEKYEINLESILNLHTEPVSSINWGKLNINEKTTEKNLMLISSSFDFSLLIWTKDEKSDIWINRDRLGQMGGTKNAFFGCCFNNSYDKILAYTYHGNFYNWMKKNDDWVSLPCISGHFSRVTDLDWNSSCDYLISCSQDQSTRVFAKWIAATNNWYELSRAQIHGYDINSIKNLKIKCEEGKKLIDIIICGADEKIIRLFEPTAIVANLLNRISNNSLRLYFPSFEEEEKYLIKNNNNEIEYKTFTEGGAQVLGLMTKALKPAKEKYTNYFEEEEEGGANLEENEKNEGVGVNSFNSPPTEDYLSKHTLWPEINKLYGHGYEIQTVTSSNSGDIIASSCKSQTYDHSTILLWNPQNYSIIDKLYAHNYTVMQLEFSKNDLFLGSVSKDRQFVLFKKNASDHKKPYILFFVNKSHARIIWSLSFSHDSLFCLTGSRDKKVKMWNINQQANENSVSLYLEKSFSDGVTACAFADKFSIHDNNEKNYIFAIGLENGVVYILSFHVEKKIIDIIGKIHENVGHSLSVNRIKFRRLEEENKFEIGSCGDDHSVRITEVNITKNK